MSSHAPESVSAPVDGQGSSVPIGVIGGSGFSTFLSDAREVPVTTPFGPPSDTPVLGRLGSRIVAFVPRHGRDHRIPPHQVNYRANLWALRALGVRQVLASGAVGSLRSDWGPGSLVVPDQVIDRTWGRAHTVYDQVGAVVHVAFADPYCPNGRRTVLKAAADEDWPAQDGATLVVVNGPRFSSRAESRWHASTGADLVGMTGIPEAGIARELALCYTAVCVVTDLDAGADTGEGVTHAEVFRIFAKSVARLKDVLTTTIAALPDEADCPCRHSLDGLQLPFDLP